MKKIGKLYVIEGPCHQERSEIGQSLQKLLGVKEKCKYINMDRRSINALESIPKEAQNRAGAKGESFGLSKDIQDLLFRITTVEKKIVPALTKGIDIILDGFWWSLWVKEEDLNHSGASEILAKTESLAWGNILPALVIIIFRRKMVPAESSPEERRLAARYEQLIAREKNKYPISVVCDTDLSLVSITEKIKRCTSAQHDSSQGKNHSVMGSQNGPLQLDITFPFHSEEKPISSKIPVFLPHLSPARATEVYDTYWRFATERQSIFFKRLHNESPPWSNDDIFLKYKFTNAYRASDRVSQYLIKHVIYDGEQTPDEIFFRIMLFKLFNKIETWQLLLREFGSISFSEYTFDSYDKVLNGAKKNGVSIYSAAYIMPSGNTSFGFQEKHRNNLKLLESLMKDNVPQKIAGMNTMQKAFELLRSYPTIGDFLAYQYVVDINYSTITNFSEMEFVVPGPGAKDGIRKTFEDSGGLSEIDIIKMMADRQEQEFGRLNLNFESLWGRPLQLIDCQNLFCEVDKYSRIAHPEIKGLSGRTQIKQVYRPRTEPIRFWYPPKWGINDNIVHYQKGSPNGNP